MQNRIKSSVTELRNVHSMVTCAVLVALYVAINSLSLFVTPTLKLTFSFLVLGMIGYRFGIATGFLGGVICDLLAYVIRPSGPLHIGFSLSTALTCAVFALFLYRREIKIWRVILARTVVNIAINIALNTFWLSNLYGKGYIILLWERAIKNVALLPIEIVLLFIVLKTFERILRQVRNH